MKCLTYSLSQKESACDRLGGIFFSCLFLFLVLAKTLFLYRKLQKKLLINHSYTVRELVITPADILWVIDNSPSMDKYHRQFDAKYGSLYQ